MDKALIEQCLTDCERHGLKQLFRMAIALRQQLLLRVKHEDANNIVEIIERFSAHEKLHKQMFNREEQEGE